jgi:chemotaxis protein MotC
MGSQVAIAQAALVVGDDPKKAASFLDIARLLSPGTLAEEAALRREILVVGELEDTAKFESLSRQYLQRFRHSVYAGNFRQRFAAALTRMDFVENPDEFSRLDEILAQLEPDARLELLLVIARAAVVQGKSKAAQFTAERALELASAGTTEEARATLYRGAASVVEANGLDAALADLKAVDQALLEPSDWALYDAAARTSRLIGSATEPRVSVSANEPPADHAGGQQDAAAPNPVIASAEDAIKSVDALLGAQTR